MSIVIYHNPRCSKSRQTLSLLREQGIEPEQRAYLTDPPDRDELVRVLDLLGMGPRELIRKGQSEYKDAGLDDVNLSRDQLIDAMIAQPVLIERPIVINGDRAALGRPPERVLEIL